MSKNLQHFVNNFVLGMQLGSHFMDKRDQAEYRRQQIEVAREKMKLEAQRHAEKMGLETRRVGAIEKDVEGRYIKNTRAPAGKAGPAGPTAAQLDFHNKYPSGGGGGFNDDVTEGPTVVVQPAEQPDPALDTGTSIFDAKGGRIPEMARGGRAGAMVGALQTGLMAGRMVNRVRGRDQWGRPINPDPREAPGTSGPGSGYGAIATRPPTADPSLMGTGETFRRGGKVQRFAQGGTVNNIPPYVDEYGAVYPLGADYGRTVGDTRADRAAQELYDQGRVPTASGDWLPHLGRRPYGPYPTGRPPQNRDQSPDRFYQDDPHAPLPPPPVSPEAASRVIGPPSEGPLWSPSGDWAREGAMHEVNRRRLAAAAAKSRPGTAYPESGTRGPDETVPQQNFTPRGPTDPMARQRMDEYWRVSTPSNPGGEQRSHGIMVGPGGGADVDPGGYREWSPRADESGPSPAGRGGAAGATEPDVPPQGAPPPAVARGGAGADRIGGAGGGGGGGGRGAIDPRWKPLRDQTRSAAFDPTKDRFDPDNVHAVDSTGAALAGATAYAQRVFGQGDPASPRAQKGKHALYAGTGAADPKLMEQIFQKVDPENRMTMDQKMLASVKNVHDFYMAQGDAENANKSAFEVAQFANQMAKQAGAEAIKRYQAGDRQGALDLAIKGYNFLPDGNTASVQGDQIVITSEAGQPVAAYPLDDRAMQNIMLGMASGQLGMDVIRIGGKTMAGGEGGPPGGPPGGAIAAAPPAALGGAAQPAAASAGPPAQAPAARPLAGSAGPARPPLTHDGLPARVNPDGSISTELSITVTNPRLNGGRPTNIPSLWGGREVTEDEAVDNALKSGRQYPSFNSIPEAVTAAEQKSAAGGANAPAQAPPPAGTPRAPGSTPPARPPAAAPASPQRTAAPPAGGTTPAQGDNVPATGPTKGIETKPPGPKVEVKSPEEQEQEFRTKNPFGAPPGVTREQSEGPDRNTPAMVRDAIAKGQQKLEAITKQIQLDGMKAGVKQSQIDKKIAYQNDQFKEWKKGLNEQLKEQRGEEKARDREERASIKPREIPMGQEGQAAEAMATKITNLAKEAQRDWRSAGAEKEAGDRAKSAHAASPLRYLADPKDFETLNRIATSIWTNNGPNHSLDNSVSDAVYLASIVRPTPTKTDPVGMNQNKGEKATTFKRLPNDLKGNVLLQMPSGRKVRMDSGTYTDLMSLHKQNWDQYAKEKADMETSKGKQDAARKAIETLTPGSLTPSLMLPY